MFVGFESEITQANRTYILNDSLFVFSCHFKLILFGNKRLKTASQRQIQYIEYTEQLNTATQIKGFVLKQFAMIGILNPIPTDSFQARFFVRLFCIL